MLCEVNILHMFVDAMVYLHVHSYLRAKLLFPKQASLHQAHYLTVDPKLFSVSF